MDSFQATQVFCDRIGRSRSDVSGEAFRSVFVQMTDRKPHGEGFTDEEALSLLVEWYQEEQRNAACSTTWEPLRVLETYRRERAWVIFLARAHAERA